MNPFINKDRVIVANCDLANIIGLNKAIVLNQINYWLEKSSHVIDGRKWVYNSFEAWHKQFSYWSLNTVKRTFKSLEEDGLIISGSYNKASFDKTKWYSIDYDKVFKLMQSLTQDDTAADSNWDNEESQNGTDNTIDYTKTTSKSTSFSLTLVDSAESTSVTEDKKPVPEEISDAEKEKCNFEIIYKEYPKKVGKAKAFDYYRQWIRGRKMSTGTQKLTNVQIFRAVKKYVEGNERKNNGDGLELQYYKNFDTFMNKAILDYLEE